MKYYKISEQELLSLLEDSLNMEMLEQDGVDNWSWYGESYNDVRNRYVSENRELDKDADFGDIAEVLLKNYEEVEIYKSKEE